jgi:hypothetical protein
MTNNPRNPLPGEQPGSPQDPSQGMDPAQEQTPGQPGQGVSGQQQSDLGPATPASGTTRSTGSSATGATPVSSSQEQTKYSEPRGQQTTSQPVQRQTTRTYEQPRRSNNNKKLALAGILGLAAVAGIVTGFAASNNSTAPTAAVHRPLPAVRHRPVSTTPSFRTLTTFNASGTRTSNSFAVTNPSAAHWSYRCASGSHPFSASMATTSGGNRMPIASTSGTSGSGTAILHPSSTGSKYQISANSACPYHIRVYGT